ncbi:MAG TPA: hypothetical protein DIT02_04170 [Pantoea ananatis]|nr:hypothetical protein [Pantoea ananatis]
MDAKIATYLTNAFIINNIPRDGTLYRFSEKLKKKDTITISDHKHIALMGFGSRSLCLAYAEKLIKAGVASATRSNGNIVTLKYIGL